VILCCKLVKADELKVSVFLLSRLIIVLRFCTTISSSHYLLRPLLHIKFSTVIGILQRLTWTFIVPAVDSKMEMVGENTLLDQKSHHRCRRRKNDCRMIDAFRWWLHKIPPFLQKVNGTGFFCAWTLDWLCGFYHLFRIHSPNHILSILDTIWYSFGIIQVLKHLIQLLNWCTYDKDLRGTRNDDWICRALFSCTCMRCGYMCTIFNLSHTNSQIWKMKIKVLAKMLFVSDQQPFEYLEFGL
jgi:hypothetical protein